MSSNSWPSATYLSETRDRHAARRFLQTALANPDNRPPSVLSIDGNRSYGAAIRDLRNDGEVVKKCRYRARATEQPHRIRSSTRDASVASHAASAHPRNGTDGN
jgi:transposase-like protein